MGLIEAMRQLFGWAPPKTPEPGPFPEIAVPLIAITPDGKKVTGWSNATIINASKGLLVTGKHCITTDGKILIKVGGWHSAELIGAHRIDDIALIKAADPLTTGTPKIPWATKSQPGDQVRITGWLSKDETPYGYSQRRIDGIIQNTLSEQGWPVKTNLVKNDSINGLSGSPAVDNHNKLIGILTSRDLTYNRKRHLPTINVTPIWFVKNLL